MPGILDRRQVSLGQDHDRSAVKTVSQLSASSLQ
jgi:hypothetical protein